jgi:hypothetical protein
VDRASRLTNPRVPRLRGQPDRIEIATTAAGHTIREMVLARRYLQMATTTDAKNANQQDTQWLQRNAGQLSDTTLRAYWTHTPGEEGDHDGQTLATRSRDVVEDWARRRDGHPAAATRGDDGRPRVLRFDFEGGPDKGGSDLERISFDEWWQTFEERDLVFVYQERLSDGSQSNFFILDSPRRSDG